ncbi:hypothetical protein [Streptacidiphilus albus]|uniref:hypothetical protein n=1 Tax=Streptacidiphilus albus TaxID=105425 RepID=UPI00128C799E|nr:hypothetical protein [Streptacidiphilus albus]
MTTQSSNSPAGFLLLPLLCFIDEWGPHMNNLRAAVAERLGQSISDGMWDKVVELSWDGDSVTHKDPVGWLVGQIKDLLAAASSMNGPVRRHDDRLQPPGEAVAARIDALSTIYAAWAEQNHSVQFFRASRLVDRTTAGYVAFAKGEGSYPDYRLLEADAVDAWIGERHSDAHVRELITQRAPNEKDPTIDLWFIAGNQERILTVDARHVLGELAKLAEKLADWYHWRRSEATNFILAGRTPEVFLYTGSVQLRYGTDSATTRVTMTLDPTLTPAQVSDIYQRLKTQLHRAKAQHSLSAKQYTLARHIGPHVAISIDQPGRVRRRGRPPATGPTGLAQLIDPHPGHTWHTLRQSWNEVYATGEHTAWRYDSTNTSNFIRDAQRALVHLLDPGWRNPPPPLPPAQANQ